MASRIGRFQFSILLSFMLISWPRLLGAEDRHPIRAQGLLSDAVQLGIERSNTFRALVGSVAQSDVIVHLTCGQFETTTLLGQTALVAATGHARYVRVQVRCERPLVLITETVAHELQHVVEIATNPSAVDDVSMVRLFSTIGFDNCASPAHERFETMAAQRVAVRVRREMEERPPRQSVLAAAQGRQDRRAKGD
jgi:hypothetical protein